MKIFIRVLCILLLAPAIIPVVLFRESLIFMLCMIFCALKGFDEAVVFFKQMSLTHDFIKKLKSKEPKHETASRT